MRTGQQADVISCLIYEVEDMERFARMSRLVGSVPCGPYMPRGLRAGFRFDAMIRRASRRWLSSASSAI